MPSPVGHLLAGTIVALVADGSESRYRAGQGSLKLAVACASLAALPDADLLYQPIHRTVTHSLVSIPVVMIIATIVTGWVTGRRSIWTGIVCGLAWSSHIPLDWLGADPNPPQGIQVLWPFSHRWFISGLDLFAGTERHQLFTEAALLTNLRAIVRELVVLGPFLLLVCVSRFRARAAVQGSPSAPL